MWLCCVTLACAYACVCVSVTGFDIFQFLCCDPVLKPCPKKPALWERCCPTGRKTCPTTTKRTTTTSSNADLLGFDGEMYENESNEARFANSARPTTTKRTPTTSSNADLMGFDGEMYENESNEARVAYWAYEFDTQDVTIKPEITSPQEVNPETKCRLDIIDNSIETVITESIIQQVSFTSTQRGEEELQTDNVVQMLTSPGASRPSSELALRVFGLLYKQQLRQRLKEQGPMTLTDVKVKFTANTLSGKINFEQGFTLVNYNVEIVGELIPTVTKHIVEVSFQISFPLVTSQYVFTVGTVESLSGAVDISLSDQRMTTRVTAKKEPDGSCSYRVTPLDLTLDLKRYAVVFDVRGGLWSREDTSQAEIIVNSFIKKYLLDEINRQMLDTLNLLNELSVLKAADKLYNEIKHNLCVFSE